MIYARVDENGRFLEETKNYEIPLFPQDIALHPNGRPTLVEMTFQRVEFDPATHESQGYEWLNDGDKILKRNIVGPFPPERLALIRLEKAKEARRAALPDLEDAVADLSEVVLALVKQMAMLQNPKDPRTMEFSKLVSIEALKRLEQVKGICEAHAHGTARD